MSRITILFTIPFALIVLLGSSSQAAPTQVREETPAFAPGQVLVRFKSDTSVKTAASFATLRGAKPVRRIADRTFTLAVPAGQEKTMVEALASDPAVQAASLNYRITETLASPPKPVIDGSTSLAGTFAGQEPSSCVTDVWMSTTQQGERVLDNLVPSGTAQVYAFFEYTDCDLEAVRVQVFYLGGAAAPVEVFNQEGFIISGSGIQGIKAQAWPYFGSGEFPIGRYLTIISLAPEGGWDEVMNVSWRVSTFPDDHWFAGVSNYQWPLHSTGRRALPESDINLPQAWDITTGSSESVIAVVSTGVAIDHPDLVNKIWTNRDEIPANGIDDDENGCIDDVHGCEFFDGEAQPDPMDTVGWGTFSAGIAAAETNNERGMAGVSWGAQIMPIKVLRLRPDGTLGGSLADMITAIDYAVANGARIIHLGPRVEDDNVTEEQLALLQSVIDAAVDQGALVVAGTGDQNEPRVRFPAAFDNVVAVGCTDVRNERCWFSNYGQGIDLVAPGELILSTWRSTEYRIGSGTSLAAAHVDGVASLLWSVNPELSPAEIRSILQQSAADRGVTGYDEEYGYGKLDAEQAVKRTPHHLWLHTADSNGLALVFLLDDQQNRTCQTIWNRGTTAQTWVVKPDSDWLSVETSVEPPTSPVPSDIRVCADGGLLGQAGRFEAELQIDSTLALHDDPAFIDVVAIRQPHLTRVLLGFIQRP